MHDIVAWLASMELLAAATYSQAADAIADSDEFSAFLWRVSDDGKALIVLAREMLQRSIPWQQHGARSAC